MWVCLRSDTSNRLGPLPSEVDLSHFCLALRSEPPVCAQSRNEGTFRARRHPQCPFSVWVPPRPQTLLSQGPPRHFPSALTCLSSHRDLPRLNSLSIPVRRAVFMPPFQVRKQTGHDSPRDITGQRQRQPVHPGPAFLGPCSTPQSLLAPAARLFHGCWPHRAA